MANTRGPTAKTANKSQSSVQRTVKLKPKPKPKPKIRRLGRQPPWNQKGKKMKKNMMVLVKVMLIRGLFNLR